MACRIVDVLPSENKVGVELVTTGTHTGTFETPFGTFPATGKPFTFRGFQVYTIENGKILSTVAYFDQATVLLQPGLLPEPALAAV